MVSYKGFVATIFILFITFGLFKVFVQDVVPETTKQKLINASIEHPFATLVFVKSVDDLTPLYSLSENHKIFNVTEFASPGWLHILIIIILLLIFGFCMDMFKVPKKMQILGFLAIVIFGYWVASWILMAMLYFSGSILGLTIAEVTQFWQSYSNSFDNIILPLIVMGIVSLLSIGKIIFAKVKQ